mmetsp:Transcript_124048/g.358751  ORF Transcript_124048/g.358751 Transcript_124048/m.358751 type:complete len:202 (+) Transcript_124048:688-1293(+)
MRPRCFCGLPVRRCGPRCWSCGLRRLMLARQRDCGGGASSSSRGPCVLRRRAERRGDARRRGGSLGGDAGAMRSRRWGRAVGGVVGRRRFSEQLLLAFDCLPQGLQAERVVLHDAVRHEVFAEGDLVRHLADGGALLEVVLAAGVERRVLPTTALQGSHACVLAVDKVHGALLHHHQRAVARIAAPAALQHGSNSSHRDGR